MSDAIKVTDAAFEEEVLKSSTPVLVDFWAEWCGPCKMLSPIIEELAKDNSGKLKVAKMDVDANSETPAKFGIRSIPTLILYKDGQPVATKVGAATKSQLQQFVDEHTA